MTIDKDTTASLLKAVSECERWLRYLDRREEQAKLMMKAAALARSGDVDGARRMKILIDSAPTVFDGANLKPAVERLLKHVRDKEKLKS